MGIDIQAGQREFRRELARDETETARRLQASYRGFLQDLQTYLNDLDNAAEAANLTTDLKSTAEFRALEEQVREALDDLSAVIESESRRLEDKGIRRGKEYGEDQLARVFASFNRPSVPQIKELVRYVDSAPFQKKLDQYGEYHQRAIANIITADASLGKNPVTTAEHIRRWVTTMPAVDAYRMTRTVQIWAARKGTSVVYQANREIVLGWWWSSALDSRTCMSCVSQHGKRFPVDETLADHHSGRCAMIPITGYTTARPVQQGEQWFNTLPESEQMSMMGKGKWEAWKAGAFGFDALSTTYEDDVYGTMYREASLKDIIR